MLLVTGITKTTTLAHKKQLNEQHPPAGMQFQEQTLFQLILFEIKKPAVQMANNSHGHFELISLQTCHSVISHKCAISQSNGVGKMWKIAQTNHGSFIVLMPTTAKDTWSF